MSGNFEEEGIVLKDSEHLQRKGGQAKLNLPKGSGIDTNKFSSEKRQVRVCIHIF